MITVREATKIVLENSQEFEIENVPLQKATGRLLMEDLVADRDFPPFDRVTMDGIAIRYEAYAKGQRIFPIEGMQAAGAQQQVLKDLNSCFEVMTGAILPQNADIVIRYEDLEIENGQANVLVETIKSSQNVHWQGNDRKKGEQVVKAGQLISAAEIGVAATIGKSELQVKQLPKTVLIYTGDELVKVAETPLPHQIRTSNVHAISTALSRWHLKPDILHILDDMEATKTKLAECLETYDVIILSGGVSKGKFDYVPEALADLGVEKLFHRIKQRPGKPFWFGKAKNGTTVFALPGNPVSSFMCTIRYFCPWLRKSLGLEPMNYVYAKLSEDFSFKPDLTYFLQVKVRFTREGQVVADPIIGHGSGDLANLADADAFLELPNEQEHFKKEAIYPLIFYRQ